MNKVCDKVFGQWDWFSNVNQCNGGCRITVGWNSSIVHVMALHTTRQMVFCLIEDIQSHEKIYCSFVYADNNGIARRVLWCDLQMAKIVTIGKPWILMGDFNVILKVEEHTAGKSTVTGDMQEFINFVNSIEVEDVCSKGMFYTWIKSPSKPNTSILKNLDRIMANDEFISKYTQAYAMLHPFMVTDHSPSVLVIPQTLVKKKRNFKFANYIADKDDFLPWVKKIWAKEVHGIHMFKLVKKLRSLKELTS